MSSMARISSSSLKDYSNLVISINEFSSKASDGVEVFDELINSLGKEIDELFECVNSLNDAKENVDDKLEQYSIEKEELDSEISDLHSDLDDAMSELASMDKFITVGIDDDGHEIVIPNPAVIAMEAKIAGIEGQLAIKKAQRASVIAKIERCHIVKGKIDGMISQVNSRISSLGVNKNNAIKNRGQYESDRRELLKISNNAAAKLKTIDRVVNEYMTARFHVSSAFERTRKDIGNKSLRDVEYVTAKFRQYEMSGRSGKIHVDDNEKVFKTKDGLVPNSEFIKNGYTFVTDNQGRTVSASGKLRLAQEKKIRNWDSSLDEMGKGYEKEKDEKGHIIGHRFDGPDSILNAVPQDCNINRGAYKSFENYLEDQITSGKDVYVDIRPMYKGESHRPDCMVAVCTIDGVMSMRVFPNENAEGQE